MVTSSAGNRGVLDEYLGPLEECFTPELAKRIIALRAAPATSDRLDFLADKNREGMITPAEMREYESRVNASTLIAILQAKARRFLRATVP